MVKINHLSKQECYDILNEAAALSPEREQQIKNNASKIANDFFKEIITDVALVNSLSAINLGKQYVEITNKACSLIKVEKEIEISPFEMKILRKVSETNRQKGIDFANEICKSYRREGKYFDEILEEALKGE